MQKRAQTGHLCLRERDKRLTEHEVLTKAYIRVMMASYGGSSLFTKCLRNVITDRRGDHEVAFGTIQYCLVYQVDTTATMQNSITIISRAFA